MAIIPNSCKFHVVSSTVDTVDRGSAEFQSQRKVYTMADIAATVDVSVSPYKLEGGTNSITTAAGSNTIDAGSVDSVIAGGQDNSIGTSDRVFIGAANNVDVPNGATSFFVGASAGTVSITQSAANINNNFIGAACNVVYCGSDSFVGVGQDIHMGGGQSFIGAGYSLHTCSGNGFVGAGYNNKIGNSSSGSAIITGSTNQGTGNSFFIGTGYQNTTTAADFGVIVSGRTNSIGSNADHSGILTGCDNVIPASCTCAMIIGSNITADRVCATFVNNLSIKNIPTASTGLPSGSVWSNSGVLNIVA